MTAVTPAAGISFRGVSRSFGAHRVLDRVDADAPAGQVTALVGPNGSGKSTLLRILLGLDRPDTGLATVHGRPVRSLRSPLRTVGALLDAGWVHPARSGQDHLRWMAQAAEIPTRRCAEVLELVGLTSVATQPVGSWSLGMRQRLGIASALLGDPPVLVFDEPLNGLDQDGVQWFRDLMADRTRRGHTVLIASHLLAELSATAGRVIVLDGTAGVRYQGAPEGMVADGAGTADVVLGGFRRGIDLSPLLRHAAAAGWNPLPRNGSQRIEVEFTGAGMGEVVAACDRLSVPLESIGRADALETGYRRLVATAGAHRSTAPVDGRPGEETR